MGFGQGFSTNCGQLVDLGEKELVNPARPAMFMFLNQPCKKTAKN
jgi:hypothetical protein